MPSHHVLQMCVQGSTSALMLVGDDISVFDPHSRDEASEQAPSRMSVLLKFNSCDQYCSYLEYM